MQPLNKNLLNYFPLNPYEIRFSTLKGRYVETPFRVDEDLESQESTLGRNCLKTFMEKGGSLVSLHHNPDEPQEPFEFLPGDVIYPSCSGGYCRSQTLWVLLSIYANITLISPHATRYGFDPFNNKVNWHRNVQSEQKPDYFKDWIGREKTKRFGYEQFHHLQQEQGTSEEELAYIRTFYNTHYFGPSSVTESQKLNRRVYVTFGQNTHVILNRLNQANEKLHNVVVVSIDLDDCISSPLKEWNIVSRSKEAYLNFANILNSLLNFSRLS